MRRRMIGAGAGGDAGDAGGGGWLAIAGDRWWLEGNWEPSPPDQFPKRSQASSSRCKRD